MGKDTSKDTISYLDGIRGLAAVIVVISHYIQVFYPAALNGNSHQAHFKWDTWYGLSPINIFYNGQFAVCLFFVLSGYVLSIKMFDEKMDNERFFKTLQLSATRRYFRLAIPAAASVFFVYIALLTKVFYLNEIINITQTDFKKNYYELDTNFFIVIKAAIFDPFFRFDANPYNPVLWTMSYELLGSFLIFGFLALFGRIKKRWIIYTALSIVLIQTHFVAFLWGMLLADLLRSKFFNKKVSILLLLFGVYLGSAPYTSLSGTIYEPIDIVISTTNLFFGSDIDSRLLARILGSTLILFSLLRLEIMKHLLGWKPFVYLGKISFSLYLIHFTIINTYSSFIFFKVIPHNSYNISFFITIILSIPVLIAISHYYERFIDQKAITIAKKIGGKITGLYYPIKH